VAAGWCTGSGGGFQSTKQNALEGMVKNGGIMLSVHCDNADWVTALKKRSGTQKRR